MQYYVHVTDTAITIHRETCGHRADGRHGPFGHKREAVSAARALAIRDVDDCKQCGGAGGRFVGCHCKVCVKT